MTILMLGKQLELGHYRAEFLRSYGFKVAFPESKQEAIRAIQSGGFDAVIVSYTISAKTRNELTELAKQVCPDCATIHIAAQRWTEQDGAADATVLSTDPPGALLDALWKIVVGRSNTEGLRSSSEKGPTKKRPA
jgi:DNA-binding NtrC family response regulator